MPDYFLYPDPRALLDARKLPPGNTYAEALLTAQCHREEALVLRKLVHIEEVPPHPLRHRYTHCATLVVYDGVWNGT